MVDIEKCREYIVLAQARNFLEASEQLNIAQSSLSKHMKSLEAELGVTLLDRTTRKVSLSADGRVFLPYAERLVRTANEARNALADQKRYKRRTVRIGSIPIMAPYGITDLLSDFDQDTPGIRLKITEGEPDLLKDQLRKGHLDLAFIRDWNHEIEQGDAEDDFIRIPYDTDQLVAVLPLTHPLAGLSQIDLAEIAHEEFLLLPEDSVMYKLILDACSTAGFVPRVVYSGSLAQNIIDLVSHEMGVSLLMRKPAASLCAGKAVLVDVNPTFETRISCYYLRGTEPTPETAALLRHIASR